MFAWCFYSGTYQTFSFRAFPFTCVALFPSSNSVLSANPISSEPYRSWGLIVSSHTFTHSITLFIALSHIILLISSSPCYDLRPPLDFKFQGVKISFITAFPMPLRTISGT